MQSSSQITTNKPTPSFYRPDALPVAQPTVLKHWREMYWDCQFNVLWHCLLDDWKVILACERLVGCGLTALLSLWKSCSSKPHATGYNLFIARKISHLNKIMNTCSVSGTVWRIKRWNWYQKVNVWNHRLLLVAFSGPCWLYASWLASLHVYAFCVSTPLHRQQVISWEVDQFNKCSVVIMCSLNLMNDYCVM